jgi:hypothetical protein
VRGTVLAVGAEGGVVTVRLGHRWPSRPRGRHVAIAASASPGSTLWLLLPVSSVPRARGLALLLRCHHLTSRPRSTPLIPCLALHRYRRHYFRLHVGHLPARPSPAKLWMGRAVPFSPSSLPPGPTERRLVNLQHWSSPSNHMRQERVKASG